MKKKSKFNLSDGEEDDFEIQDGGYFPERDDFEDDEPYYGDDYDDDVQAGKNSKHFLHIFIMCSPLSRFWTNVKNWQIV